MNGIKNNNSTIKMDILTKIKILKKEYYNTDEILKLGLEEFKKCTNGRRLIENIKIGKEDYIYAAKKNEKWIKTDGSSRKFDKVLIKVSCLEEYINNSNNEYSEEETPEEEITKDILQIMNVYVAKINGRRKYKNK
ncbi:hypothetical protein [Saudi moumouvirus]|nr:hypothetical protein [Saudi moumouvirus]